LNLGIDPVHDAATAEVDGERSGAVPNDLLKLGLPRLARVQVVLVEPDAQAVFLCLGCRLDAQLQCAGGFGVDPSMAQKEQGRPRSVGVRHQADPWLMGRTLGQELWAHIAAAMERQIGEHGGGDENHGRTAEPTDHDGSM
jgi:hypothetical protein